jgi:hypothetical protein
MPFNITLYKTITLILISSIIRVYAFFNTLITNNIVIIKPNISYLLSIAFI